MRAESCTVVIMNIFRTSASWLCLYLVVGFFFLTANAFAIFNVINAENLKETLREEDTYGKIVPAVLSTASYREEIASEQQIPLNEPWVREVADRAFPASDLERKGEQAIDGTFNWLEGETAQPGFQLDFTNNKQALSQEIAAHVQSRAEDLPRCGINNIPASVDAFRADCLPFGVSPQRVASDAASLVNNDQGLLGNPVISSDNLSLDASEDSPAASQDEQNPFDQMGGLRSFFENKGLLLWLLPFITAVLSLGGVFLARDRLKATGRLAKSFLTAGVGLLVFGVLFIWGFEKAVESVSKEVITRELAGPVMVALAQQMRTVYLIFALIAFLLAIFLFVVRKRIFSKDNILSRP